MTTKHQKVQSACEKLNHEAAQVKSNWHGRGKGRQFTPCSVADALIQNQRDNLDLTTSRHRAINENHCSCHPGLTAADLLDYMFG